MEPETVVEAVLFSAGRPLRAAEISDATGLSQTEVRKAIKKLISIYDGRSSAIVITRTGLNYSMQLRDEVAQYSIQFADKDLSDSELRTVSIIAYNQPILQSDLAKLMGSDVYEDVRALRRAGLVSGKKKGQTWLLTTTTKFSEKFGIGSTKKEDIKRWFESRSKRP
ncbi:MAG: SMC-Scp complex subunit ScpB [Methanomassiliicoccales archaeon]|nr:MAG: SMC-Scp complex subunit ScpB [Methanomassiliicoccales archaeon]